MDWGKTSSTAKLSMICLAMLRLGGNGGRFLFNHKATPFDDSLVTMFSRFQQQRTAELKRGDDAVEIEREIDG